MRTALPAILVVALLAAPAVLADARTYRYVGAAGLTCSFFGDGVGDPGVSVGGVCQIPVGASLTVTAQDDARGADVTFHVDAYYEVRTPSQTIPGAEDVDRVDCASYDAIGSVTIAVPAGCDLADIWLGLDATTGTLTIA